MLHNIISELLNINVEYLIIICGIILYYFHYLQNHKSLFISIIITTFVLSVFDIFIKKILLLNVDNDYYKFVINNVITIVIIDYMIYFIRGDSTDKSYMNYFNLAFACFFYETIVFKLYNYNNLCDKKLRNMSKTIMRLATIHILSNFLDQKPYDEKWFNFSFGQIFNFSLFNVVFID